MHSNRATMRTTHSVILWMGLPQLYRLFSILLNFSQRHFCINSCIHACPINLSESFPCTATTIVALAYPYGFNPLCNCSWFVDPLLGCWFYFSFRRLFHSVACCKWNVIAMALALLRRPNSNQQSHTSTEKKTQSKQKSNVQTAGGNEKCNGNVEESGRERERARARRYGQPYTRTRTRTDTEWSR